MPSINEILKLSPRSCTYGAPLGDSNVNEKSDKPLHLQQVRLSGGYAADGTYWGTAEPLWCAFNAEDERYAIAQGVRVYVRARSRTEAIAKVQGRYPEVTFKRS